MTTTIRRILNFLAFGHLGEVKAAEERVDRDLADAERDAERAAEVVPRIRERVILENNIAAAIHEFWTGGHKR